MTSTKAFIPFLIIISLALSVPAECAKTVNGTLLQVTGKSPSTSLLVLSGSKVSSYKLTRSTKAMRGEINSALTAVKASSLQPGDQVTLECDSKNSIISVSASFQLAPGQVKSPLKRSLLLADGQLFDLNPGVRVTTENGTALPYSVLRRGDYVTLKLNPVSREAWKIVLQDRVVPVTITSISHNAERPLKAGDMLIISLEGTAGGRAVFSVTNTASNVKMSEVKQGHYVGTLMIRKSTKSVQSAAVVVRLSKDGSTVGPVQASRLIFIDNNTMPTITITENRPTPKPKPAPRPAVQVIPKTADKGITILRPSQGAKVHNPLTVVGKARPGCKLRTTVTYSNGMTGLLKLEGTLCHEELKAGDDGRFQSNPISLPQAYAGKDLEITVKVEPVGEDSSQKPVVVRVKTD